MTLDSGEPIICVQSALSVFLPQSMKIGFPYSLSIIFWFFMGILRVLEETFSKPTIVPRQRIREKKDKVAVCIPAHNEGKVILKAIKSIKKSVPAKQIYVVSDGSSDKTASIAKIQKVNVLELIPGKGKAKALVALIKSFKLLKKYEFILFLDADTLIKPGYIHRALELFEKDASVSAISGYVVSSFKKHKFLNKKAFFEGYRVRLNTLLQFFLIYGQTWKYLDVTPVIPGSCSMYRTKVLAKLKLDTPGILIEDFNLAFQIHRKKLGRIAHHPRIYSIDQDPDNLRDYWNQVKRWNIGFFQTVRKYGFWPSRFWLFLGIFNLEVLFTAIFVSLIPFIMLFLGLQYFPQYIGQNLVLLSSTFSENYITPIEIIIIFLFIDYALTVLVALNQRKYKLLVYGILFFIFQYLNSIILLYSLPIGFFTKSTGSWSPPRRR